jgi:uncharacterized protein YjbI with pentapeptide repeats
MKSQDVTQTYHFHPDNTAEQYEVIEHVVLSDCIQKDLTISGSLLSKNVFRNVYFRNCVFFGDKFENCDFQGCTFEDCEFQFSKIDGCNFTSVTFKNCSWLTTIVEHSLFQNCLLDVKATHHLAKYENMLNSCFRLEHQGFGALNREIAA